MTNRYYCGQTDDIAQRLSRHNNCEVKSTKHGVPWKLVGYVLCEDRSAAMQLEKSIKKRGIERWIHENKEAMIFQ